MNTPAMIARPDGRDGVRPRLGLIVPPAHGRVPVDGALLYGERVEFVARGLGLGEVSPRGYEQVIDMVVERAAELAEDGVTAVSLMGTSLSFYRGSAFAEQMLQQMAQRTGLPCSTMSHAIVRSLRSLGVERVAVATSYIDEVDRRLVDFLHEQGLRVAGVRGLGISGVEAMSQVSTATLVQLADTVLRQAGDADGLLISCGGLITLDAVRQIEARHGLPVVSSSPAGFHDLMSVAGLDASSPGNGRLFEPSVAARS